MKIYDNGVIREMTTDEINEMKITAQEAVLQPTTAMLFDDDKLRLMLDSVSVTVPDAATDDNGVPVLPIKIGYKWQPVYSGTAFGWELVADPNAVGTADNPIIWTAGVRLIPNAYYLHDNVRYVYMGDDGFAGDDWDVTNMEEF